jgi:phosphoribosylamine--glycine ligase
MAMAKVLLVGSGGREHALAWKIKQTPGVELYTAPGNAGTAALGRNVPIKATDLNALLDFAKKESIELTVVGPDDPLSMGIVDTFQENGQRIFGPTKAAARLEWDKDYAKNAMDEAGIPTANYESFTDFEEARDYVRDIGPPLVIKASGLALGKGVIMTHSDEEAVAALDDMLVKKKFGVAGDKVIVEELLEGEEASVFVLSDGRKTLTMLSSQDHKRVFDNDQGPNTGGMGAYAPAPVVDEEMQHHVDEDIIRPIIDWSLSTGIPYRGVLYLGLMIGETGARVLEFNARFGDPETQAILPLLKSDLVEVLGEIADGELQTTKLEWHSGAACCVVMASGGYPGHYEKGKVITGLDTVNDDRKAVVFHAGTALNEGKVVTNGGRVLNVVGRGDDIKAAIDKAYSVIPRISFEGMHYRKDIGYRALERQK